MMQAPLTTIGVAAPLLARLQRSGGRLVAAVMLHAALIATAVAAGIGTGAARPILDTIREGSFRFALPITVMLFAQACLGDLHEDRSLVFLTVRPVHRWALAVSAFLASLLVTLPVTVPGTALIAVAGQQARFAAAAAAAAAVATVGYAALFVALGLRTRRSLLWGLGYILLFEGLFASLSPALAALSVRRYATAVFADVSNTLPTFEPMSAGIAVLGVLAFVAVGIAATTRWLTVRDVP